VVCGFYNLGKLENPEIVSVGVINATVASTAFSFCFDDKLSSLGLRSLVSVTGQMELAVDVWNGLPTEVLERVLSFLPVLDLCRYRLVSKRWHFLISKPAFGALWVRNAHHPPSFIVARYFHYDRTATCNAEPSEIESGVSLFDLKTRRWHKVRKHGTHPFRDGLMFTGTWAMDGGLICQYKTLPTLMDKSIVVYNPFADKTKDLPPAPVHLAWGCDYPLLNMTVDLHGYNVFLFCSGELVMEKTDWPLMLVYNSNTNAWVCSTDVYPVEPDCIYRGGIRYVLMYLCSVMFRGALHVLIRLNSDYRLWRYEISRDMWEDVGLRIVGCTFCSPELVVAGDRLFMVTWSVLKVPGVRLIDSDWRLEVSEIATSGGACESVLKMSNALVLQVFGAESAGQVINRDYNYGNPPLNAFGYRESIILMSMKSGVAISYDIASHSWDLLPRNPSGPLPGAKDYTCYGKQMSLILPCVQW